jgi:hypothetical protein
MAARVAGTPSFSILGQQRLFSAAGYFLTRFAQVYDVSPDGRFLMLRAGASAGAGIGSLILVENFLTELRKRAP